MIKLYKNVLNAIAGFTKDMMQHSLKKCQKCELYNLKKAS